MLLKLIKVCVLMGAPAGANTRGECKDQSQCTEDNYFQSSASDAAGSCIPCGNTTCLVGGQTTLTQFRTGVCDATNKGYTCEAQPTCWPNQYLKDATPLTKGICADQPTCTNGEHLQGATATSAGVCSSCAAGSYGGAGDGSCIECKNDPQCTADAEYLNGTCAGKEDTRTCVACSNLACKLGQYRTGFCAGRDDDYVCASQPVCEDNYFLDGADATTLGTCTQCKNTQCLATQYRTGACVTGVDGFICTDQPTCTNEQFLNGGDTFTKGECTNMTTSAAPSEVSPPVQTAEDLAEACAKPEDAKCQSIAAEKCPEKAEYAQICPDKCGKCPKATHTTTTTTTTTTTPATTGTSTGRANELRTPTSGAVPSSTPAVLCKSDEMYVSLRTHATQGRCFVFGSWRWLCVLLHAPAQWLGARSIIHMR